MSLERSRKLVRFLPLRILTGTAAILLVAMLSSAAQAVGIAWHGNLQEAAQLAAAQHKPMLVMVKARWCGPCHKMLEQTFSNPAVAARINSQFVPVLLDADDHAAAVQSFGVDAMPTVLIISPERKVMGRFTGFQSAAQLGARLAAFTPASIRQFPPPQFRSQMRSYGNPSFSQSLAFRPGLSPQSETSFLRRHAIARLPPRLAPFMPGRVRPYSLANAAEFGELDTSSAAKAFSAEGSAPAATVAAKPTPNPPG